MKVAKSTLLIYHNNRKFLINCFSNDEFSDKNTKKIKLDKYVIFILI